MRESVLVIGLDGMTFDVLRPLIAKGLMPLLGQAFQRAAWAPLRSTVPPFSAPAWATFMTGMNPGWHGVIAFQKSSRHGEPTRHFVDGTQIPDTLWEIVSRADGQVIVINVPLTYPPRPVNGILVSGMLTPSAAHTFTYPAYVQEQLDNYIIDLDYLIEGQEFRQDIVTDKAKLLSDLTYIVERQSANATRLLQTNVWNLAVVVFTVTDRLLHFFWDEIQELLAENTDIPLYTELIRFWKTLDAALGQLLAVALPDTRVVFISDHGFGPAPYYYVNVNVWLEQQGWLFRRRGLRSQFSPRQLRVTLGRIAPLKAWLRRLLPFKVQRKLRRSLAGDGEAGVIDWNLTQAYMVPLYAYTCGIAIPTVRAGRTVTIQEYEALRHNIMVRLTSLCDAEGRSIVQHVYRREDLYHGPYLADLPDVVVVFKPAYAAMVSLAEHSIVVPATYRLRSGDHMDNGIFGAFGPDIVQGEIADIVNLVDITPTILHMLRIAPPRCFDGKVLTTLFTSEWLDKHPLLSVAQQDTPITGQTFDYTDEEEALIQQRLERLGYL